MEYDWENDLGTHDFGGQPKCPDSGLGDNFHGSPESEQEVDNIFDTHVNTHVVPMSDTSSG